MISRVSNQNGVSLVYIMLEIRHSGREPSIYSRDIPFWSGTIDVVRRRPGHCLELNKFSFLSMKTWQHWIRPSSASAIHYIQFCFCFAHDRWTWLTLTPSTATSRWPSWPLTLKRRSCRRGWRTLSATTPSDASCMRPPSPRAHRPREPLRSSTNDAPFLSVSTSPVWVCCVWCLRLDIGTEEDSLHQLDRAAQVTIFSLRTGHCQLLAHLHRLNISHSDECSCGSGPQTPNHILQSCLTFEALRRHTWSPLSLAKLHQ